MTRQCSDRFIYNGELHTFYCLPHIPFNIRKLGLSPTMLATSCWRGYVNTFTLDSKNRLLLKNILTNNGNGISNIPSINGINPIIIKPDGCSDKYNEYRYLEYNEINIPVEYSGIVRICPVVGEYCVSLSAKYPEGSARAEKLVMRLLHFIRRPSVHMRLRHFIGWPPVNRDKCIELAFSDGICIGSSLFRIG